MITEVVYGYLVPLYATLQSKPYDVLTCKSHMGWLIIIKVLRARRISAVSLMDTSLKRDLSPFLSSAALLRGCFFQQLQMVLQYMFG